MSSDKKENEILQPRQTSADGKITNDTDKPIDLDAPVRIVVITDKKEAK